MTEQLKSKLHPQQYATSGKWAAIVGYILGETFTDPVIDDMCITSDGCVLAQHEGDLGMNEFIQRRQDDGREQSSWINLRYEA